MATVARRCFAGRHVHPAVRRGLNLGCRAWCGVGILDAGGVWRWLLLLWLSLSLFR